MCLTAGLTVHDQFGNFTMKNSTDIELAGIDEDKSIAFVIKHDDKLDPKLEASFQCAMLYTTATGERRVRVINLSLPVTDNIANVFRNAQMDVTVSLFMRQGMGCHANRNNSYDRLTNCCYCHISRLTGRHKIHCATA
jgi:protein transport protein SEC24